MRWWQGASHASRELTGAAPVLFRRSAVPPIEVGLDSQIHPANIVTSTGLVGSLSKLESKNGMYLSGLTAVERVAGGTVLQWR